MKLDTMPETGKVLIGNPRLEPAIAREADKQGLDYFLSDLVPPGKAYVMDIDLILAPVLNPTWDWR